MLSLALSIRRYLLRASLSTFRDEWRSVSVRLVLKDEADYEMFGH